MVALGPRVGGAHVNVSMRLDNRSINLLGGQIHRQLAKIGDRNRGMYQSLGRESVVMWRTMLAAATTGAPLIGSAISGVSGAVTMLVGAMRETVIASGGLIGIAGSVGFAMMTMSFGFNHVIDAIKEIDPKKLEQQLAAMTPPAREFTLAMRDLLKTLQEEVQPRIFAGLLTEMEALRSDFIPVVTKGFLGMADALNGLMKDLVQYATSGDGLATINTALQGSVTIFEHLSKAVVPFLDGFLKFHNALIPASIRLSDRIAGIAERFQAWSSAPGFAERIDDRMKMAEKTAGLLFKVLGNLGSAIGNIFTAINPQTNTFLEMLVDVTGRFKEWSSSVEGAASLQKWAGDAIDVMAAFGRGISSVFKVLTELSDSRVIISFLDTVAGAFDHLNKLPLAGIVSKFADLAEMLQPISSYLLAIIIASASFNVMLGAVAGQLGGVAHLFVGFSDGVKKMSASIKTSGGIASAMGKSFSKVLGILGRFVKFAGPVGIAIWIGSIIAKSESLQAKLGEVWDSMKGVFDALVGAFQEITPGANSLFDSLQPVFNVLDKIMGLAIGVVLDTIKFAFDSLAKAVTGVGRVLGGLFNVLAGLFTWDFGKMWDGLKQMASGIWPLLQGVFGLFVTFFAPAKLLKIAAGFLKGFGAGIASAFPAVVSAIGALIPKILTFFVTLPVRLAKFGFEMIKKLGSAIASHGPSIGYRIGWLVGQILEFFATLPIRAVRFIAQLFEKFMGFVVTKGPGIITAFGRIVENIVAFFISLPRRLANFALIMFIRLQDAVIRNGPVLLAKVRGVADKILQFFKDLPGKAYDLALSLFVRFKTAVEVNTPIILARIGKFIDDTIQFFKDLPGKAYDFALSLFVRFKNAVEVNTPIILARIGKFIDDTIQFFKDLPGKAYDFVLSLFARFINAVDTNLPIILAKIGKFIGDTLKFFKDLPGKAYDLALRLFVRVQDAIVSKIPGVLARIGKFIDDTLQFFKDLPGKAYDLALRLFIRVQDAVVSRIPGVLAKIRGFADDVVQFFRDLPGKVYDLGLRMFIRLQDAIVSKIPSVLGKIRGVKDDVINIIKQLPGQLLRLGRDMIGKLAEGMLGKLKSVKDAASSIVNTIKGFFPGSPVKEGPLTAWNYGGDASRGGRNIIDALTTGLGNTGPIKKAMAEVASTVTRSTPHAGGSYTGVKGSNSGHSGVASPAASLVGLRIEGTLNTSFGPAEIRGVVRSEIAGVLA